ncbi:hypothetical protein VZT92_010948 [Zoarces viviparus]|uniref:Uncharacterized protein n=1 Tax=Zoarces viviparus TaxID=48416 RepID=A0AAW1FA06_ZOAVI
MPTPGSVSQYVRFPDGVEQSAMTLPLGISHLCPLCMTVDGKTYGGAGRTGACVMWGKGAAPSGARPQPRPGVHAGCRLMLRGYNWHGEDNAAPPAQREWDSVKMTFNTLRQLLHLTTRIVWKTMRT